MRNYQKLIVIKTQIEGTHYWSQCNIDEVNFLKNVHRHIFHIRVIKEVSHNERDIEIIQFKRNINDFLKRKFYIESERTHCFNNYSCESIAELILEEFKQN